MPIILNVRLEAITVLFSQLIFDVESFSSFVKIFMIWERSQPRDHVKFVLEWLDWDRMYHYHHHPMEVTRDQFLGFVSYAVKHNVTQAMFIDSTRHLLMNINVQHHLTVLSYLSNHTNHFPSHFAFLFFKALYRPSEIDATAHAMFIVINNTFMRRKLEEIMKLITDMYDNLFVSDHLLPPFKFCSRARNLIPFSQLDGKPFEEDMWNSLCTDAVQGNYREDGSFCGQGLKKQHIWNSKCHHCTLQLIVFKLLFGVME